MIPFFFTVYSDLAFLYPCGHGRWAGGTREYDTLHLQQL